MSSLRDAFLDDGDIIVYQGDCLEVMREMAEASVDAIVTDPPYGLEFMGKEWDAPWRAGNVERVNEGTDPTHPFRDDAPRVCYGIGGSASAAFQAFSEAWAREAFRVLKPGGHLLAFAGTRTYHRMASGVEDAGFEIRDCIAWMYGSGFPKSLDVSKAIDKAAGAEREAGVAGPYSNRRPRADVTAKNAYQDGVGNASSALITTPATPSAAKWSGWGTALKPAFEPIVVARKPLTGTVAENILEHGTGALNIDACRIGTDVIVTMGGKQGGNAYGDWAEKVNAPHVGRWPANVTLDETAAAMLDEQSGYQKDGTAYLDNRNQDYNATSYKIVDNRSGTRGYDGGGGASRFFYTAKASRQDRNNGGLADNTHPTVKPTELMRWLIRLATPPGGIILDPFGGSGSTGVAARAENTRCILIERETEYLNIIRDRLAQQSLFAEEHRDS